MTKKRKKVTLKDISEHLGLSINAVSLALKNKSGVSEKTRSLILKTAHDLGYFTEQRMNTNHSKNICLLLNNRYLKSAYFYSRVVFGIENMARKYGFDIIVNFMDNYMNIPPSIESGKVSGILIVGTIEDSYLEKLLQYNIPIVLIDHTSHLLVIDSVLTQNVTGAFLATKYLIDHGHKKIGFFGDIDFSLSFRERWLGFYDCTRKSGLFSGLNLDTLSKYSITAPMAEFVIDKDYASIAKLVSNLSELPTAWFCSNDETAIALYYALDMLGLKVPDDVSLIGFDDIDLCNMLESGLTTIHVSKELMGEKAVKRLIWRMENPTEPVENISLPVSLVERGSVKRLTTSLT